MSTLAAELTSEAAHLGRRLGHPVLRLAGTAGVLNPEARAVVSVFGRAVDQGALVREVTTLPVRPQLLVLDGITFDEPDLLDRGWRAEGLCLTLVSDAADLARPGPAIERVTEATLGEARRVMDEAFGDSDADECLPDGVTGVPDLQLMLRRDDSGRAVGLAGVRRRRKGALVFGVGVVPDARRAGVAAALVGAAAAWSLDRNEANLHVNAEESSLPFWSALGFTERARWRSYTPVG